MPGGCLIARALIPKCRSDKQLPGRIYTNPVAVCWKVPNLHSAWASRALSKPVGKMKARCVHRWSGVCHRVICSAYSGGAVRSYGSHEVVVLSGVRTPMGSLGGSLASMTAPQLGSVAIRGALANSGVDPESVSEVIMGNVLSAGVGQAPARQAALAAGLSVSTSCTTINKMCASGMKSIMFAAQAIASGASSGPIVAGGMESMSNAPYLLPKARSGYKLGHGALVDSLLHDGLWDAFHDCHMGDAAELCALEMGITRGEMDDIAVLSYQRALQAQKGGSFQSEIVPVTVPSGKRGEPDAVAQIDEEPKKFNEPKLRTLKPVFKKDKGTVTAGNASVISDGAAALVLCARQQAEAMGVKPVAQILGMGDAAQEPLKFTTTPALAVPRALAMAGLEIKDVDYFEINEAFAVVSIANQRLLGLTPDRVNVHGGAVALGHPIGASGARIVISLINVLKARQARHGVAAICNGGGGASALVIKLM